MAMSSFVLRVTIYAIIITDVWAYSMCNDKKYRRVRDNLSKKSHRQNRYYGHRMMNCASQCLAMENCNFLKIGHGGRCYFSQKIITRSDEDVFPKEIWPQRLRAVPVTDEYRSVGAYLISHRPTDMNTAEAKLQTQRTSTSDSPVMEHTLGVRSEFSNQPHRDVRTHSQTSQTTSVSTTFLANTIERKLKSNKEVDDLTTVGKLEPLASVNNISPQPIDKSSYVTRQSRDPATIPPVSKQASLSQSVEGHCRDGYTYKRYKPKRTTDKRSAKPMCLNFHNELGVSWDTARSYCQNEGGRLVVANNKMKFKVVMQYMKHKTSLVAGVQNFFGYRAWIGLQGNKWTDGSRKTYEKLEHHQPAAGCVSIQLRKKLRWRYEPCQSSNYFICEMTPLSDQ